MKGVNDDPGSGSVASAVHLKKRGGSVSRMYAAMEMLLWAFGLYLLTELTTWTTVGNPTVTISAMVIAVAVQLLYGGTFRLTYCMRHLSVATICLVGFASTPQAVEANGDQNHTDGSTLTAVVGDSGWTNFQITMAFLGVGSLVLAFANFANECWKERKRSQKERENNCRLETRFSIMIRYIKQSTMPMRNADNLREFEELDDILQAELGLKVISGENGERPVMVNDRAFERCILPSVGAAGANGASSSADASMMNEDPKSNYVRIE